MYNSVFESCSLNGAKSYRAGIFHTPSGNTNGLRNVFGLWYHGLKGGLERFLVALTDNYNNFLRHESIFFWSMLTTLSVAKIIQRRWHKKKWNIGNMIARKIDVVAKLFQRHFFHHKVTWSGPGLNLAGNEYRPASNRPSRGTAASKTPIE